MGRKGGRHTERRRGTGQVSSQRRIRKKEKTRKVGRKEEGKEEQVMGFAG